MYKTLPLLALLALLANAPAALANNYPLFDISTLMRMLLVPVNTDVGAAIYRLRGRDAEHDYPLHFEILGDTIARVENLPCLVNHSFCDANVVLAKKLEAGRLYDMKVSVKDTQGHTTTIGCTIRGSNGTTRESDTFPHRPSLLLAREDAKKGTVLGYVTARRNPNNSRHASLEIWGSPSFGIEQSLASSDMVKGSIFLKTLLDFELQSMYTLTVCAMDAYVEPGSDTRNLACFRVAVAVVDVQDTAPVFTSAPPITRLSGTLQPGDVVMIVRAEDGDRGAPRALRYGLVSEGNPFTPFFQLDEHTGKLTLTRPLKELAAVTGVNQPIVLTLVAQEVKTASDEPPSASTTVQVALLLGELGNTPPYFDNSNYVARVAENSPQGVALQFADPYVTEIRDDNMGKNGVFSLTLENNNGTFEVSPTVGERRANFVILVRNNQLLDYEERKQLQFTIVAREVGPGAGLSSTAQVLVYLDDVNDNPPVFLEKQYMVEIPENVTAGTRLTQVLAEDVDTGMSGKIQYTGISGHLNTSLTLDPYTGVISVATNNHKFDREAAAEFRLTVEARDMEGVGNRATVPLIIKLLDVNDETPRFERSLFEFILTPDLRNFTVRAFLKATDLDAEPPNNVIRYEIMNGNYDNKFYLDDITGELTLLEALAPLRGRRMKRDFGADTVIGLTVRAYDLGVPHRWSHANVRVYPPETRMRTMRFVVAGSRPDLEQTERMLAAMTGGRVKVTQVLPYVSDNHLATREGDNDKSVVVATVMYDSASVVDVSELQFRLKQNETVEPVREVRAENRVLFWILMFLAFLIVLILLLLLLCCACPCCLLYVPVKTRSKIHSSEENVHLVVKEHGPGMETKSVQAGYMNGRREAWSADIREQQWRFNRRNARPVDVALPFDDQRSNYSLPQNLRLRDGPGEMLARERDAYMRERHANHVNHSNHAVREVYLEDMDGASEFPTIRLLHPRQAVRQTSEDEEEDSMRRHEVERGSDVGYRRRRAEEDSADLSTAAAARRDQFYIREGDAEILRLLTRGRQEEFTTTQGQEARPMTLVPRQGKDIIMRRFIEDQRHSTTDNGTNAEADVTAEQVAALSTEPEHMSSSKLQELLLKRLQEDEVRREETQSLPGHVTMATQTDKDRSTQTDPPRRRARSDNGSLTEDELDTETTTSTGRWIRRYHGNRRKTRSHRTNGVAHGAVTKRHKIKTPILEETESTVDAAEMAGSLYYADNKSSMLRRRLVREKMVNASTSVDTEDSPDSPIRNKSASLKDLRFGNDEEVSAVTAVLPSVAFLKQRSISDVVAPVHTEYRDSDKQRAYSSILKNSNNFSGRRNSIGEAEARRQSTSDVHKRVKSWSDGLLSKSTSNLEARSPKKASRYMEWYKTKKEFREREKAEREEDAARRAKIMSQASISDEFQRLETPYREKITKALKPVRLVSSKSEEKRQGFISKSREKLKSLGEHISSKVLGVPSFDDDLDSGIAMSSLLAGNKRKKNQQLLEKKSVFTIAYDDMHTKQLRPDTSSPTY